MIQIRAVQDVTIGTAAGTLRLVVGQTYAVDEEAADHAVRGRYAEYVKARTETADNPAAAGRETRGKAK